MKKVVLFLLSVLFCFTFVGCGAEQTTQTAKYEVVTNDMVGTERIIRVATDARTEDEINQIYKVESKKVAENELTFFFYDTKEMVQDGGAATIGQIERKTKSGQPTVKMVSEDMRKEYLKLFEKKQAENS